MNDPSVDVVIAVHDLRRAIHRAVASVLTGTTTPVRVTVVGHGLDADALAAKVAGDGDLDPRVRVVAFADGIASPAGPFNYGLDLASAAYTSVMGSDDVLEPGAVDNWFACAARTKSDAVIAQARHGSGSVVRTPPVRLGRTSRLDGIRDRLAYRSAPLGLVSRTRFGGVRFTGGVSSGEDIAYVNALWFSGARVAFARGPGYRIMDDDGARVTLAAKPVREEFAALPTVLAGFGPGALGRGALTAYATKFLRVQVFGAVHNRPAGSWGPTDRTDLAACARQVLDVAPRAAEPLSIADRRLLDAVLDPDRSEAELLSLARARRRFGHPATLVPRNVTFLAHREAPVRFMCASLALGR